MEAGRPVRWSTSGVNLHWTKWGAMGHSSPKLIASQRLTVSLHPPLSTRCLFLSFLFDPFSLSLSPLSSLSPRLSFFPSRHIVLTYIVPPNNICSKGRETTDSVPRLTPRVVDRRRSLVLVCFPILKSWRGESFLPFFFSLPTRPKSNLDRTSRDSRDFYGRGSRKTHQRSQEFDVNAEGSRIACS